MLTTSIARSTCFKSVYDTRCLVWYLCLDRDNINDIEEWCLDEWYSKVFDSAWMLYMFWVPFVGISCDPMLVFLNFFKIIFKSQAANRCQYLPFFRIYKDLSSSTNIKTVDLKKRLKTLQKFVFYAYLYTIFTYLLYIKY